MSRLLPNPGRKKFNNEDDFEDPLLHDNREGSDDEIELADLELNGRERTPVSHYRHRDELPKKHVSWFWIASALAVCVIGFVINTEATAYVEDALDWKKPFATMYLTHGSLVLPWIVHIFYLRWRNRSTPYQSWVRDYNNTLRSSIATIDAFATSGPKFILKRPGQQGGPLDFLASTMAIVTVVLTISGASWFTSLSLTTPADLTAIYNCATFFAAAFSVPILKEKLGRLSIIAVALSIGGTFTIAYGDTTAEHAESSIGASRFLGNIIACAGAVAFGLYEVLFKKWACSSRPETQESSIPLTLAASALTGFYTLGFLWIAFPILHIFGIEEFALPSLHAVLWIVIAVLSAAVSITLLALLVVWTDPVFGSMANVLSVFFVALADWLVWGLTPSAATYIGGTLILVAFAMLSYDTMAKEKD
ncbi:hypothetical protein SLS60_009371 [Paraconiothyrium brasiliense]|uniref:EamA domain-containing protein n=1 Tax=Paraconiothyrium brasiliense TaxID=300254 RepID=A0ABR3QU56_9PLEO